MELGKQRSGGRFAHSTPKQDILLLSLPFLKIDIDKEEHLLYDSVLKPTPKREDCLTFQYSMKQISLWCCAGKGVKGALYLGAVLA